MKEGRHLLRELQTPVISAAGWGAIWMICSTVRYQIRGWDHYQKSKSQQGAIIYSFWHNQIFCATHFWRFRKIVVITSQNFDGEYIARIIHRFGYGTARGSSSRGAVGALLRLKKYLQSGRDVAFTIDGPRGPRYQVKPGPLWLSQKTGAPIVPFHIQPKYFWELRGWDQMRIPKPFSPVLVNIGPPIRMPNGTTDEAWLSVYQEQMSSLSRQSENYWGKL